MNIVYVGKICYGKYHELLVGSITLVILVGDYELKQGR